MSRRDREVPPRDGVAVEWISSSDLTIWGLLHDGTITELVPCADRLSVTVVIPYLRARMAEPGSAFVLELREVSELEYTPYDESPIRNVEAIAAAEPDIVTPEHEDDRVVLWGSAGVLRLRYRDLTLRLDNGAPLALATLDECARGYWDDWERITGR